VIICLEGPDLAGKTTVAQWMQAELTRRNVVTTYIKRGPIRDDPMTEYLRPLDALLEPNPKISQTLILDRWHVGELIYGPLLRGRSELTAQQANYIEMVMQTLGCTFVHVTAPVAVLQDRWDIRGDSLVKREWLNRVSDEYWDYVSTHPHWESIAATHMTTELIPLTLRLTPSPFLGADRGGWYVGPHNPAVLLLGDVRNEDEFVWPFVPRRATSGHWLMGALAAANVDHMRVGIVNACELSLEGLSRLWTVLDCPPVVTLGRNAERAWRAVGPGQRASQTYLHHPQHQRRFHYRTFAEYGQQIKKAMR
jgi:hypothetical protein